MEPLLTYPAEHEGPQHGLRHAAGGEKRINGGALWPVQVALDLQGAQIPAPLQELCERVEQPFRSGMDPPGIRSGVSQGALEAE